MNIKGKTVLVTGGGSGIGLELARGFADRGATTIITGRNPQRLEAARQSAPQLNAFRCDVQSLADVEALARAVAERHGGIDVLVNNAGVMHLGSLVRGDFPLSAQMDELDIDLGGVLRTVHVFLPSLLQRHEAAIVNVSSLLALVPLAAAPVYSAAKAAVHAYSQALREQVNGTRVKVFELMPPTVDTTLAAALTQFPKISPRRLAERFFRDFEGDRYEITPGQTGQVSLLRRLVPGVVFRIVNKGA